MNFFRATLVCGLVMLVTGCASLSKDECINADWQLIGFEDGAGGVPKTRIAEHRKACASHGVVPNKQAYDAGYHEGIQVYCNFDRGYLAGRYGQRASDVCPSDSDYPSGYEDGLISFCTYDVGYREGIDGRAYLRVCPMSLEREFLAGYELGATIHSLRVEQNELEAHVQEIIDEQEHHKQHIKDLQRQIVFEKELSVAERLALVDEMNELGKRVEELDAEHADLDGRIEAIQYELEQLGAI